MTHSSNAREWSPDRIGSCNCIPISTFVSMAQILQEIKGTSRCCNVATVADFLEDVRGHIIQPAFSRIKTNHLYCPPADRGYLSPDRSPRHRLGARPAVRAGIVQDELDGLTVALRHDRRRPVRLTHRNIPSHMRRSSALRDNSSAKGTCGAITALAWKGDLRWQPQIPPNSS
jgi:hypothetical protein